MNKSLESLLDNGCMLRLFKEEDRLFYLFEGFYKYGVVKMFVSDNSDDSSPLHCITRYGIERLIYSFDDFREWNLEVHESYKDSFSGWSNIEYPFNERK